MNLYAYKNMVLSHTDKGFKMEFPSHWEAVKYILELGKEK